jgi:hypothetical protein
MLTETVVVIASSAAYFVLRIGLYQFGLLWTCPQMRDRGP